MSDVRRRSDLMIRFAGASSLVAALAVAAFSSPAPVSRETTHPTVSIGICHDAAGVPTWSVFDAKAWVDHRQHASDRVTAASDCRTPRP